MTIKISKVCQQQFLYLSSPPCTILDDENTLVGMEDEFNSIRDQLIGQTSELNLVSIAGMGDIEIPADRLAKIWVAEGFLKTIIHKKPEEVAEECLEDLVGRSLIMVSRRRATGKIRTCRIHDLLRLLCLRGGKTEKFFHVKNKCDDVSSDGMEFQRRLCLYREALQNKNLNLEKGNFDSIHTILCLDERDVFLEESLHYKIISCCFQLLR
uniref:Late blight resistance protein homolog R1A-3 n=1 Tax=Nicotiana sylvestris TaxID=4096 RepID=A0A1U7W9I7_NICSY